MVTSAGSFRRGAFALAEHIGVDVGGPDRRPAKSP